MPKDIVTGDDAESVAAYVASVAALPVRAEPEAEAEGGGGGGAADGKAVFADAGCGGCHTLKAAGATGNVGPNLDDAKPAKDLVVDRVTNGKGVMPSFKDSYSAEQIAAVADFVSSNAGK
jgi:mono/diheme cytochrome c family protein